MSMAVNRMKQYAARRFEDDAVVGANTKLAKFLNDSSVDPNDIISITHSYDATVNRMVILLVYMAQKNPYM